MRLFEEVLDKQGLNSERAHDSPLDGVLIDNHDP